jgi:hypothetical protein
MPNVAAFGIQRRRASGARRPTTIGKHRPKSDPDAPGPEAARLAPDLVLCDRSVPNRGADVLAWIEYRPYDETSARLDVRGQRYEVEVVSLADLLSVIDRAEDLV